MNYSYEKEQEGLQRLLDECLLSDDDEGETYEDSDDEEEPDEIECDAANTDSEQDISENELEIEETEVNEGPKFVGKDGKTMWLKHKPTQTIRTRSENLVTQLPGTRNTTKCLKTMYDIWNYFFPDQLLNIIVDNTNLHIQKTSMNYSRERDSKLTDISEIKAFLGLLYLAGVLKSNHLNTNNLWKTDGTGVEIFRLTMSERRFKFLLRHIRFDDLETRQLRRATDNLAPIRDVFEIFVDQCKNGFTPFHYVTVDEKLEAFRGRCAFRQYIPNKPNKYGLKIFALCDSRLYYTVNLEVYVGKQPPGPYEVSNSPQFVMERMCEPIRGTGRNVTVDNWFTSFDLLEKFKKDFKLTVVGTIRKNKRELPLDFSCPVKRPIKSSMFAFHKNVTLVSYIPKKGKNVLLVSSMHHDDQIDDTTGKPEMIMMYNSTKGGVDTVDQLCSTYNCARNTRRWPMVIFYSLLNIGGINSLIIFKSNNPNSKIKRREFLSDLAFELIKPYLEVRRLSKSLPRSLTTRMNEILKTKNPTEEHLAEQQRPEPTENQRGRCGVCDRMKNRPTRYFCKSCKIFLCLEHATLVCSECFQNNQEDAD